MRTQRPVISSADQRSTQLRRRRRRMSAAWLALHALETRVLLSAVVNVAANGKSATYTDVDGDTVTFAITVGALTAGDFTTAAVGILGDQLEVVDLTAGGFAGTNITVTDKKGVVGDGLANIGYINASGNDLGTVSIAGDLGRIDCGDSTTSTMGLKSLTVRSMGRLSLDSQGGTGSLGSHIIGALGSLTVKGDLQSVFIGAEGGANGTIGTVSIGGSLIGSSSDHSGEIFATGNIGTVKIAGDIQGGSGLEAGAITSTGGGIASVAIGGSIFGGSGLDSGAIEASGEIKAVTVGGDVRGRTGDFSGTIDSSTGSVDAVTIGGSLIGNSGNNSGQVAADVNVGVIKIVGDVEGSTGGDSGTILASGSLTSVALGGSLVGSAGSDSGYIAATLIKLIGIKHDIQGSDGLSSGSILGGTLGPVTVGGSMLGASGAGSGQIGGSTATGTIAIGGDLRGGTGQNAGEIQGGSLGNVTIGGSILGGTASDTGAIEATNAIGVIKIGGDIHGGGTARTGIIASASSTITSVAVGGSVVGTGASGTGLIFAGSNIGTVTIGHSLIGGSDGGTSSITQTGAIISTGGGIGSVTINGSILAGSQGGTGALTDSGAILAGNAIGSLTVKQNVVGVENGTASTFVMITARGQAVQGATTDVAIGKVTIGGRVQYTDILGGYDTTGAAVNADAQIGTVAVGGDWVGSNLVAGAKNTGGTGNFGDANDVPIFPADDSRNKASIVSTISSVTIKGYVYGTPANVNATDEFGFVAEQVAAISIAGIKLPVTAAPHTDTFVIPGNTGDVKVHEI